MRPTIGASSLQASWLYWTGSLADSHMLPSAEMTDKLLRL